MLTTAARFPVDITSERAVQTAILEAEDRSVPASQLCQCADAVLRCIDTLGKACSPAQLAVVINNASHRPTMGASGRPDTFISPLVEEREVNGERGFYAREALPAGTLILAETPSILLDEDPNECSTDEIQVAAAAKEAEQPSDFASLVAADVIGRGLLHATSGLRIAHGVQTDAPSAAAAEAAKGLRHMTGVTEHDARAAYLAATNNGFLSVLNGASVLMLFARISIFNHACFPNCSNDMVKFGKELSAVGADNAPTTSRGRVHVYTVRRVRVGEELTLTYEDANQLPTPLRRAFLDASFNFTCGCERCEAGDPPHAVDSLLEQMLPCPDPRAALHEARVAHSSLFTLRMKLVDGVRRPCGFSTKPSPSWRQTRAAAAALVGVLSRVCAPTHWMAHMARDLHCRALEALADELCDAGGDATNNKARKRLCAEALGSLIEYASTHMQLVPPYSASVLLLATRVERARARVDAKAERAVIRAWGPTLEALREQEATVAEWLRAE